MSPNILSMQMMLSYKYSAIELMILLMRVELRAMDAKRESTKSRS